MCKLRPNDKVEGRASQAEEMACSHKHQVLLEKQGKAQNAVGKGQHEGTGVRDRGQGQITQGSLDYGHKFGFYCMHHGKVRVLSQQLT